MEPITTLGQILTSEEQRDAVHVAIAPVKAALGLAPGEHIGLNAEGLATSKGTNPIGVVDPFLLRSVVRGEQFWMFLYPNTIASLRHEWTHPAFETNKERSESEQWLRSFAERLFSYEPEEGAGSRFDILIAQAEYGGFGTDIEYGEDCQPTEEFWDHFERYTGRKVGKRPAHFRCAC